MMQFICITQQILKYIAMKQGSKKDNKQLEKAASSKRSSAHKEIDKLIARIGDAKDSIKQTEKLLDVDLFLKQQKQKRLEHAKNINADFQTQKRLREEKLYKKYDRQKKQVPTQNNIEFKTLNILSIEPISILKVMGEKTRKN